MCSVSFSTVKGSKGFSRFREFEGRCRPAGHLLDWPELAEMKSGRARLDKQLQMARGTTASWAGLFAYLRPWVRGTPVFDGVGSKYTIVCIWRGV